MNSTRGRQFMDGLNQLLLSCLGSAIPDCGISGLRNLGDDEWNLLLELAVKYNVASNLYSSLCQLSAPVQIPSEVQMALRNSYHRTAARNMRVYQQLLRLLEAFNTESIPVILLKGAHLAELVYGNIALRPMGDIDILVKHEDLSKSGALLKKQGYEMSQEDVGRSLEHLPPFRKKGCLDVEIHFNIAAAPVSNNFVVEELWNRAKTEQIQGVDVLTLCPEDLLLHLCLHTTIHHCFDNGIRPFIDVHRTLNHYGQALDNAAVIERSKRWGVSSSLYVMLKLTGELMGTPLPTWRLETIYAEKLPFHVVETAERLVFDQPPPISFHVARLFGPGSWRDRLRVLMNRAFPPLELMTIQGADKTGKLSIAKLYYFRLRGIIKRHRKSIWSGLWNRRETSDTLESQGQRNMLRQWFENG